MRITNIRITRPLAKAHAFLTYGLLLTTCWAGQAPSITVSTITLTGQAADPNGLATVTWRNDRGGSGAASLTLVGNPVPGGSATQIEVYNQSTDNVLMSRIGAPGIQQIVGRNRDAVYPLPLVGSSDASEEMIQFAFPDGSIYPETSFAGFDGLFAQACKLTIHGDQTVYISYISGSNVIWTASAVVLQPGTNNITVTATNLAGNSGQTALTIYNPPNTNVPIVNITSPTSTGNYSTTNGEVNLGGTASFDMGLVGVNWSNDRGGSGAATLSPVGVPIPGGTATQIEVNNTSSQNLIMSRIGAPTALTIVGRNRDAVYSLPLVGASDPTQEMLQIEFQSGPYPETSFSGFDGQFAQPCVLTIVGDQDVSIAYSNASGSAFTWATSSIVLQPGTNNITVTAEDSVGSTGQAAMMAVWVPLLQDAGIHTNQLGFNISWASGMTVVIEACTNLSDPLWSPLQTNTLGGTGSAYFSDPDWTDHPARFYRVRSP